MRQLILIGCLLFCGCHSERDYTHLDFKKIHCGQHYNDVVDILVLQRYMFSVSRYCKRTYSESGYQG